MTGWPTKPVKWAYGPKMIYADRLGLIKNELGDEEGNSNPKENIPKQGGMLIALYMFHRHETSELVLGLTSVLLILSVVSSLQLYGKPIFDGLGSIYTSRMKPPCPWWFRAISRVIFGFFCFFSAITISLYGSQLQVLCGGFSLPLILALPCFMWIKIKKPEAYGPMWWFNWTLGLFGMALGGILIAAGVYVVIVTGIEVRFFKPH
ncbi:lysine histidine transporter-like 8 [Quercus suber]|uniref:Lysine histidine transporter-like 8 n=1 Tax=Quercus suber TaxID=58331 RepID=A0AAW0IIF2_QUESU